MQKPKAVAYCTQCGTEQDIEGLLDRGNEETIPDVNCGNTSCGNSLDVDRILKTYEKSKRAEFERQRVDYEIEQDTLYAIVTNKSANRENKFDAIEGLDEQRLIKLVTQTDVPSNEVFSRAIGRMKSPEETVKAIKRYNNAFIAKDTYCFGTDKTLLCENLDSLPDSTLRAIISDKGVGIESIEKRAAELLSNRLNEKREEKKVSNPIQKQPPVKRRGLVSRIRDRIVNTVY